MPVIFDSCFGEFPDLEKYRDKDWMACPGQNRLGPEHWPAMEKYVRDVVGSHKEDRRIVMWDVMNEPYVTSFNTEADRGTIHTFLGQALEMVRRQQPSQPLTIGWESPALAVDPGQYVGQDRRDCLSQLHAANCARRCAAPQAGARSWASRSSSTKSSAAPIRLSSWSCRSCAKRGSAGASGS